MEIGKKSCGKVLTAEGYIGINVIDRNQNYFYADVGPVTFQKFFDAFCISVSLPKPLADSGFPNGFKTSFSLLGKELPHSKISIPVGYRFKGTINILGLEASADINISPTRPHYHPSRLPAYSKCIEPVQTDAMGHTLMQISVPKNFKRWKLVVLLRF